MTVAQLQAVLAAVPASVSYWNRESLIQFANQAFLEWFAPTPEAIVGRHVREVADETGLDFLESAVGEGLGGRGRQFETSLLNRAGTRRRLSVRIVPDLQDGLMRGVIVFAEDVTDQREAMLELAADDARMGVFVSAVHFEQQAALEAEQGRRQASDRANKAKSEFLASMSHEIRTPMNAILGLSYLALQSQPDNKARSYMQKVHRAAENLLGILNDILDFSKAEAGEMKLAHEPFALAEVMDRVMETAGVKAQAKSLQFTLDVDPRVPGALIGDALRLGQVLLNLCDNAIKFTERGKVIVQIESVQQLGQRTELIFSVADTGAGIPTEKQGLIFKRFAQAEASTARSHGGSGLGLSICGQLVDLMGGHLGVSSQVGSGSTFHFNALFESMPATEALLDRAAANLPDDAGRNADVFRRAKVLLVEDNEVNQLVACEIMRGSGIEVLIAEDGRRALEMLATNPGIELVLMDCHMPVMDGFAATRAIRSHKQFHDLPVVAMTANVLPDDLLKCRGVGMNDHVGKPFLPAELFEVLRRWLKPAR